MNLLILTEDFYPSISGGALARWRFAQIAAQRDHNVSVVTPRRPDTASSEFVDGIEITRPFPAHPPSRPPASPVSTATRLLHSAGLFVWLQWWARDRQFDAVYSPSNTLHWVASAFGHQRDIPSASFVGYTPSMRPESQSTLRIKLERLNFAHGLADHVFCRLPSIKNLIEECSDKNAQLIHGVLNGPRIRDAHRRAREEEVRSKYANPDENLLVFAGRLSEEKNVPATIDVLSELPPAYKLVVIGDGPEQDNVKKKLEQQGLRDRVTTLGELSHEETLTIIAAADGLLLPSHTESYGAVVFEGLALGCEVFATPVGILPEVEHSSLWIAPVKRFSDNIRSALFERTDELEEETLAAYSMERFADQILGAIDGSDS